MKALPAAIAVLVLFTFAASPATAGPTIKAYYNGQEATVTGVKLKVGEPFTVDLDVTPDRYTTVAVLLRESGGGDDAYSLISGDPKGSIVRKKGGPDDPVHFHWVLAPGGGWTGGTAPLNIEYDVWGETMDDDVQGYFTVVEAYVSPERYPTPKPAGDGRIGLAVPAAIFLAAAIRFLGLLDHRLSRAIQVKSYGAFLFNTKHTLMSARISTSVLMDACGNSRYYSVVRFQVDNIINILIIYMLMSIMI